MLDERIKEQARQWEGPVPEDWQLLGIAENRWNRFRYYADPEGGYHYTAQKKKASREPRLDVREESGYVFARRRYKRRMYEVW